MLFIISLNLIDTTNKDDIFKLDEAIQGLGPWSHRMPNMWLVECRMNANQIRDVLNDFIKGKDQVFVARITANWAARAMGENFQEWMNRRNYVVKA